MDQILTSLVVVIIELHLLVQAALSTLVTLVASAHLLAAVLPKLAIMDMVLPPNVSQIFIVLVMELKCHAQKILMVQHNLEILVVVLQMQVFMEVVLPLNVSKDFTVLEELVVCHVHPIQTVQCNLLTSISAWPPLGIMELALLPCVILDFTAVEATQKPSALSTHTAHKGLQISINAYLLQATTGQDQQLSVAQDTTAQAVIPDRYVLLAHFQAALLQLCALHVLQGP